MNGTHHLPLFEGNTPADVINSMEEELPENIFSSNRQLRQTRVVSHKITKLSAIDQV